MRNLQEQVKKAFCYQKMFWPFTVWINCFSGLKKFGNSRSSALIFKSFSRSLEQFFLTVGQNNFGHKIPFLTSSCGFLHPNYFNVLDLKILRKKLKSILFQKLFSAFTFLVTSIFFQNFWPSVSNLKKFSQSLQQFFSHNAVANKIPLFKKRNREKKTKKVI